MWDDDKAPPPKWWQRVAWMVAIWGASVACLGLVAMIIRYWLSP